MKGDEPSHRNGYLAPYDMVFCLSHSSLTSFLANLWIQAGLQVQRPHRVEVSMTWDLRKTDKCQYLRWPALTLSQISVTTLSLVTHCLMSLLWPIRNNHRTLATNERMSHESIFECQLAGTRVRYLYPELFAGFSAHNSILANVCYHVTADKIPELDIYCMYTTV